ncbi:PIG-L deacetylase family protein [Nitrospira moscoviensis]|uniref:LmbE-like protein n=1 Tax=Nitrospira moscoviensis TaxID=42253 RepID=A0A0K2GCT7_NITMO|nr:PIG-L family deacetylase [Nitrospira moscoviensis]ALA58763.1 hypothetical protein NITMOv2_2348 [Nitrospira moscoviensis]
MLPAPLSNLLVLSPHCDDAVLACGEMLEAHPGSVVATVFAGCPPAGAPLTEWDRAAGFQAGDDVMGARRAEDLAALSLLGATPQWLDFLDDQYPSSHADADVRRALDGLIRARQPAALVVPLGLFHRDHRTVHEAAMEVALDHRDRTWVLYEDVNYRRIPGLTAQRLHSLEAKGAAITPVSFPVRSPSPRKMQAVQCYRSQLRALLSHGRPGYADAFAAERYWRVAWNR